MTQSVPCSWLRPVRKKTKSGIVTSIKTCEGIAILTKGLDEDLLSGRCNQCKRTVVKRVIKS